MPPAPHPPGPRGSAANRRARLATGRKLLLLSSTRWPSSPLRSASDDLLGSIRSYLEARATRSSRDASCTAPRQLQLMM